jgi:putative ABC transport system ATP-binding protein
MSKITLKNISKIYTGKTFQVHALTNLNMQIEAGEIIGIMGPSGSGKTTLLNILGLIDTPTHGEYYFDDKKISENNTRKLAIFRNRIFGFVLQDFALIERYTVTENIKIPLVYSDVPRKEWTSKVKSVMDQVGISDKAKMLPSQISGGQRQRVAIARALVNEARFILADEPTGALDSKTGDEIMNIFRNIRKGGTSIIIVTHDHHIAAACDRILEINDGVLNEGVSVTV